MKHIIVTKVDNLPGVVSRISGLFTRRGYNIESFVTSVTGDPSVYQLTISLNGSREDAELLVRQLGRIMEVIEVSFADDVESITRELLFIKLCGGRERYPAISEAAEKAGAVIVGGNDGCTVVQAVGDSRHLDEITGEFERFGIIEIIRSGALSIII